MKRQRDRSDFGLGTPENSHLRPLAAGGQSWPLTARMVSLAKGSVVPESYLRPMSAPTYGNAQPIRFADYDLVHFLGRGGMAEVWSAVKRWDVGNRRVVMPRVTLPDTSRLLADPFALHKPLALKVMHPRLSGDENYREMFAAETAITMQLTGANIVSVFGIGEHDGLLYMAMERIDGVNLFEFQNRVLTAGGIMPLDVALHIVHEILAALFVAHEHTVVGRPAGVIHRDIKPGNVLISSVGDVMLTDFGIARPVSQDDTGRMSVPGTLRYMAPEQARGVAGVASDLFAVGAIFQELVTGRRFRDECQSDDDLRRAISYDSFIPKLDRALPADVEEFRRSLLHPDPLRRIRSAREALSLREVWRRYGGARLKIAELYEQAVGSRSSGFTRAHEAALPSFLLKRQEPFESDLTVPAKPRPSPEDVASRNRSLEEDETATYNRMPWLTLGKSGDSKPPGLPDAGNPDTGNPDTNAPRWPAQRAAPSHLPVAQTVTAPRQRGVHGGTITPTQLLDLVIDTKRTEATPDDVGDLPDGERSSPARGSSSSIAVASPAPAASLPTRRFLLLLAVLVVATVFVAGAATAWLVGRSAGAVTNSESRL